MYSETEIQILNALAVTADSLDEVSIRHSLPESAFTEIAFAVKACLQDEINKKLSGGGALDLGVNDIKNALGPLILLSNERVVHTVKTYPRK